MSATYSQLTAEAIYKKIGLVFSEKQIQNQLKAKHSFYFKLLRMPAHLVFNSVLDSQCEAIRIYTQERLVEYLLSDMEEDKQAADTAQNGGAAAPDASSVQRKEQLDAELEQRRIQLLEQGEAYGKLQSSHNTLLFDTLNYHKKQNEEWLEFITIEVNKLAQIFQTCRPDIPLQWTQRILDVIRTQTLLHDIPLEVLQMYRKETPTWIEKAIFYVCMEMKLLQTGEPRNDCIAGVLDAASGFDVALTEKQSTLEQARSEALMQRFLNEDKAYLDSREKFLNLRDAISKSLDDLHLHSYAASQEAIVANRDVNLNLTHASLGG